MNAPAFDPHTPITLLRHCAAVLIPEGTPVTLEAGASVYITQALGGSVTINVNCYSNTFTVGLRSCFNTDGSHCANANNQNICTFATV